MITEHGRGLGAPSVVAKGDGERPWRPLDGLWRIRVFNQQLQGLASLRGGEREKRRLALGFGNVLAIVRHIVDATAKLTRGIAGYEWFQLSPRS